jgi:enterochelin esterase family protein
MMMANFKNSRFYTLWTITWIVLVAAGSLQAQETETMAWPSFRAFIDTLTATATIDDGALRQQRLDTLWQSLLAENRVPFVLGDSVAFLYRGQAESVHWTGDFNRWGGESGFDNRGQRVGASDVWLLCAQFPTNARLDYKIVLNGSQWILDPANPFVQWGGYGPNSELRMPAWLYPQETLRSPGIAQGSLSAPIALSSAHLGYKVNIRVYTPAVGQEMGELPVLYITDGHEYADARLGAVPVVLDNLIADGRVEPVLAVFIDPRNPENPDENRRMQEYNLNPRFADFVAQELTAYIDSTYRTRADADGRAILGTSMGGLFAAYLGTRHSDRFHLLGIQSPAFSYNHQIYSLYAGAAVMPLRIAMTTGVIHDTEEGARRMHKVLSDKGYAFDYREVNESHSWGNWRALVDEILLYFWGGENSVGRSDSDNSARPATFQVCGNYPNPFNEQTTIEFSVRHGQNLSLVVYDLLGRRAQTVFQHSYFAPGSYRAAVGTADWPSGIYSYCLQGSGERRSGRLTCIK